MLSLFIAWSAILPFLPFISAGTITFRNQSPSPVCFKVEYTHGKLPNTDSICDYTPAFWLNSTQNVTVTPLSDTAGEFNGAITAINPWAYDAEDYKGTRYEINYMRDQSGNPVTWYDADYQMGISNGTLGPADHRNHTNGDPSLTGEVNALAKANVAWNQIEDKSDLAPHFYYVQQGPTANLTKIRIDKKAPFEILEFFQVYANLSGYVGTGSVDGVFVLPYSREGRVVSSSDKSTNMIDTHDMEIIVY